MKKIVPVAVVGVLAVASAAHAQATPPTFEVNEDLAAVALTIVVGLAAAGAGILIASLGAGAGFRLVKKAYAWVMGKM